MPSPTYLLQNTYDELEGPQSCFVAVDLMLRHAAWRALNVHAEVLVASMYHQQKFFWHP